MLRHKGVGGGRVCLLVVATDAMGLSREPPPGVIALITLTKLGLILYVAHIFNEMRATYARSLLFYFSIFWHFRSIRLKQILLKLSISIFRDFLPKFYYHLDSFLTYLYCLSFFFYSHEVDTPMRDSFRGSVRFSLILYQVDLMGDC